MPAVPREEGMPAVPREEASLCLRFLVRRGVYACGSS